MDNFMDKIAQRLAAQEIIRANSAAEAAEFEKLQMKMSEYDACMQEIRKLNLRNSENELKIQEYLDQNKIEMQRLLEDCIERIQTLEVSGGSTEEIEKTIEEMTAHLTNNTQRLDELFRQSNEFAHKENVKVYRNVQAVVIEEMEKLSKNVAEYQRKSAARQQMHTVMLVIAVIASLTSAGIAVLGLMGIL